MKIGFVAGAWDLLHAGHLHLLEEAKSRCDYLIVGLHENPALERHTKNTPIESLLERQFKLRSCKYIDEVIVYKTEAELSDILKTVRIDVRFLGSDYVVSDRAMQRAITDKDIIPIEYIKSLDIHTSDIRERIKES